MEERRNPIPQENCDCEHHHHHDDHHGHHPHPHPHPPKPPHPPVPPEIQTKDIILTKKLNGVLYELMVKTTTNQVYISPENKVTLTERLCNIADDLITLNERSDTFDNKFADLMKDAPETFRTFKEVWDYVNVNGDPKSELIRMIDSKQDAEEGKGLSTHDLTDVLYEKLTNDYTKEELDDKFDIIFNTEEEIRELVVTSVNDLKEAIEQEISDIDDRVTELEETPNVITSEIMPTKLVDYGCWYQVISKDPEEIIEPDDTEE